jgi:hypothetical protein
MDPLYSSLFSDAERTNNDDWFQPAYFDSRNDYLVSPTETTLDSSLCVEPDVLGTWKPEDTSFNNDALFSNPRNDSFSTTKTSRTPSLCDDAEYLGLAESQPLTPSDETTSKTKRKRGRPRLVHADSDSSYGDSTSRKSRISKRQPHNEVEKKYREGLNAELERLRLAIPTLPQYDSQTLNGPPKPSKATVLASAIDYIHKMEHERDRLRRENELLRNGRRMAAGQGMKMRGGYKDYAVWRPQTAISFD